MAGELRWRHSMSGRTVYAVIRSTAGTYWNGSALEAHTVANWDTYDIALAESPASGYVYVGDWPATLTTYARYWVEIFDQADASPGVGDTLIGTMQGVWTGAEFSTVGKTIDEVMLEEAIRQGYRPERDQIVAWATTAADRGVNLAAVHDAAVTATPTSTDWVTVFIPPWDFDLAAGDEWDTDYIHYRALFPEMGGRRSRTDDDAVDLSTYRPPKTVLYCTTANTSTIVQSTSSIRMTGFAIAHLGTDATNSYHALYVSCDHNAGSEYDTMYFFHRQGNPWAPFRQPVGFARHVMGKWRHIIGNQSMWRQGPNDTSSYVSMEVVDAEVGSWSICGDYGFADPTNHTMTMSYFEDVKCIGAFGSYASGYACFGGCSQVGSAIDETCTFVRVEMGNNSAALGQRNAGTWIDCIFGNDCGGATRQTAYPGEFAGVDIRGRYGVNGIGGTRQTGYGLFSGTAIRSIVVGSLKPYRMAGGTWDGVYVEMAGTNQGCVLLLDSLSKIHDSTLLPSGTGYAIDAASALTVDAVNVRTGANFLGANVTNTGKPVDVETYDPPTKSETDAGFAAVPAAVEAALVNDGDATALLQAIADKFAADFDIEEITLASVAAAVRDAILNRVLAGNHDTAGTVGKLVQDTAVDVAGLNGDSIPSDYATPQNVADVQAALEAAIEGTGTGARTVTIHVTKDGEDVEGALVRLSTATDTRRKTTPASGIVEFRCDDATWTPSVTYPLHEMDDSDDDPLVVDGDKSVTYTLTALTVTPSESPFVSGYVTCYVDGVPTAGVDVDVRLTRHVTSGVLPVLPASEIVTVTSGVGGLAVVANLLLPGGSYAARSGDGRWFAFTVPATQATDYAIPRAVGIVSS